jgi:hypothetical protein
MKTLDGVVRSLTAAAVLTAAVLTTTPRPNLQERDRNTPPDTATLAVRHDADAAKSVTEDYLLLQRIDMLRAPPDTLPGTSIGVYGDQKSRESLLGAHNDLEESLDKYHDVLRGSPDIIARTVRGETRDTVGLYHRDGEHDVILLQYSTDHTERNASMLWLNEEDSRRNEYRSVLTHELLHHFEKTRLDEQSRAEWDSLISRLPDCPESRSFDRWMDGTYAPKKGRLEPYSCVATETFSNFGQGLYDDLHSKKAGGGTRYAENPFADSLYTERLQYFLDHELISADEYDLLQTTE